MPYKNKEILYEEYLRKINKTLNYIQKNFSKKVTIADLAKISGFSTFHFLRIFTILVGETPVSFIKRVKIEKAANYLLNNHGLTITQISFKCGYPNSQSLARDFKEYFKITPTQYQKSNNCNIKSNNGKALISAMTYNVIKGRDLINQPINKNMEVKIKKFPALTVAYIRHIGQFKGNSNLFNDAFEKLCAWAYPNNLITDKTLFLCAYYDDPKITNENKMRVDICMSIPNDIEPVGTINKEVFPSGQYATAMIEAKNTDDFEKAWDELYRNWLLKNGHKESNDRPCLEIYHNDPKKDKSGKYIVEICVPIE